MYDLDYQRIAKAIHFLRKTALQQPSLDQVAEHVGLSPHHFQRLFKRFSGVSPKRFLQHLTSKHAKQLLRGRHKSIRTLSPPIRSFHLPSKYKPTVRFLSDQPDTFRNTSLGDNR